MRSVRFHFQWVHRRRWAALLLLASAAGLATPAVSPADTAGPLALLTGRLVQIGALRAPPKSARVVGDVPGHTTVRLEVVLQPRDPVALAAAARAVATPGSPSYRHYLPRGIFAHRFGATTATIADARSGLAGIGLGRVSVSANHLSLNVVSSAAIVSRALHVRLLDYVGSDGQHFQAPAQTPSVPSSIAGDVIDILGLDTQPLVRPSGLVVEPRARTSARLAALHPHAAAGSGYTGTESATCEAQITSTSAGLTPDQIAGAYGLTPLYQAGDVGAGVTVGVIEFSSFIASDIAAYASCLGIAPSITEIPVKGGPQGSNLQSQAIAANMLESELDLEDLLGLVPGATILDYEGPSTNGTISNTAAYDVYTAAIDADEAKVITTSFGICEPSISTLSVKSENALFEQAALQGQTIVAAAGDNGSEDCSSGTILPFSTRNNALAVDDPASQPFVTGVGGTTLTVVPTRDEVVWNTGQNSSYQASAGGGGVSTLWPMPAYQSATSTALGVKSAAASAGTCTFSGGCREVPDVAMDAGDPYAIYCSVVAAGCGSSRSYWTPLGGTSAAAPAFAAIIALADAWPACQQVLPPSSPTLGFVNPDLYAVASGPNYQSSFTDITSGNNDLLGNHGGDYAAGVGYDLASGLGSPIAATSSGGGLVSALCAPSTLSSAALNSGLSPPALSSISPKSGTSQGGRSVAISGIDMTGASEVLFGTVPASSFRVASDSRIVAVAPPGEGAVHLYVVTRAGMSSPVRKATFTYLAAPFISRLSPPSGPAKGHNTVVIIGHNLTAVARVSFGTRSALTFKVRSASRIVVTVPAGQGSVRVTVATRRLHSASSPRTIYRYR